MVLPCSVTTRRARSSRRPLIPSATAARAAPRSTPLLRAHDRCAFRAASSDASACEASPSGTSATVDSSAGLMTGRVSRVSIQEPPTSIAGSRFRTLLTSISPFRARRSLSRSGKPQTPTRRSATPCSRSSGYTSAICEERALPALPAGQVGLGHHYDDKEEAANELLGVRAEGPQLVYQILQYAEQQDPGERPAHRAGPAGQQRAPDYDGRDSVQLPRQPGVRVAGRQPGGEK